MGDEALTIENVIFEGMRGLHLTNYASGVRLIGFARIFWG